MANATGPLSTAVRDGEILPIALAAVKVYRGAAAAIVAGTGYGTPLLAGYILAHQFVGIFEETYDNSAGTAGAYFTMVRRKGLARGLLMPNYETTMLEYAGPQYTFL